MKKILLGLFTFAAASQFLSAQTLQVSVSVSDLACNSVCDGSATATTTDGTAPFTYSWDDPGNQTDSVAIGLCAGIYTVTVIDSLLDTVMVTDTVLEPALLAATATTTDATCNGISDGTGSLAVSGGTAPYVIDWGSADTNALGAGTHGYTVSDTNSCSLTDSVTISEPTALNVTPSTTDITCNGLSDGTASLAVAGGTAPYVIDWGSADTNALGAGAHSYMVTDTNGCSVSDSVAINEPAVLSTSISVSIATACNPDSSASATATPSGGTSPYNYQWDDPSSQTNASALSLPTGDYTVVVTDNNGCSVTESVTVGLVISVSSTSPICGGVCDGIASVTASGSGGVYAYAWDDPSSQATATATSLCDGYTYTVVVTDTGGCTETGSVVFIPLNPLSVTITTGDIDCYGDSTGSATAAGSGTGGYSYFWPFSGSTAASQSNLGPGTYDVILTDVNSCSIQSSATITQPAAPLNSSIATTICSCHGVSDGAANLSVSGGTSPYTYNWEYNSSFPAPQPQDTSGMVAGSYWVVIKDNNGCETSDTAVISEPDAVALSGSSSPDGGLGNGAAWVIAAGGTAPYNYAWNDPGSQTTDSAKSLTMGAYQVIVTDDNGCSTTLDIGVADVENPLFENTIEGNFDDFARSLDLVTGGGYVIAGYTESFGAGGSDAYLVNLDENGNYNWSKTYGGTGDDAANAVISTSDGGYIMAGFSQSFSSIGNDIYITKTDAGGTVVWSETHGGSGDEKAYAVVELAGGGYIVAGGTSSFGAGNTDMYLIRLDANSAPLWTKTYGGPGYDYAYDAKQTSDGGYILAGYTYSYGSGEADVYLVKTDEAGDIEWTRVIGGAADDIAWSVIEISTGGYAIAGTSTSFGSGEEDIYFVITDASGTPVVTKTFGGTAEDHGTSIAEASDGGFAIAGYSKSYTNQAEDICLIKTDANGEEAWTKVYAGSFNDRVWDVKQSTDNGFIMAGNSQSFGVTIVPGYWEQHIIKASINGSTNCNSSGAQASGQDVNGNVTEGGADGPGGAGMPVPTIELTATPLSQFLCYETTAIEQVISEDASLHVYPNPNSGQFFLQLELSKNKSAAINIYDLQGQRIIARAVAGSGETLLSIDLGEVPAGMYYVQLVSNGDVVTKKVAVQ